MRRFIAERSTAHYVSVAEPITYAFEELLGESAATARRLLHDWFFYRQLEDASWCDGRASRGVLLDAERVGAYLSNCPRGIVVATIHLGDYLEGLRQLRLASSWTKQVFVVRRAAWSDVEQRAFARIASEDLALTVLRAGRGAAMTAIRELRRGNVLVVLYDLPQRFGRAVEVDFFGRRANVVRGPAEIAVLGDADILPVFTHYDAMGTSIVEAMPVVAARSTPREDRLHRIADITQQLCTWAEQQIRRHPSQWAHWLWVQELLIKRDHHRHDVAMTSRE